MNVQKLIDEEGVETHLIHFAVVEGTEDDRTETIPCQPKLEAFHAAKEQPWPWQRTTEARAVTCRLCKDSKPYKAAQAALEALQAQLKARR